MSAAKKKIKDYLKKGMRRLKHRKGFGVHSPFAYSVITEVIEEKLPYYAYRRMQRSYSKQSPIPYKVACLLLRLANRFGCRNVAELTCDGGYSLLPLILTDTRLRALSLASPQVAQDTTQRLAWLPQRLQQVSFVTDVQAFDGVAPFSMILLNANPFAPCNTNAAGTKANALTPEQQEQIASQLVDWVMAHSMSDTVVFVHGIQPHHNLELFWDMLCDRDDVSITMDLYDYGLAILKPRFFKQHYVVSF